MTCSWRVQGRALTVLLLLILLAGSAFAQAPLYPGATWTRTSTPEQLGWSPEKLNDAKAYAATINTTALMIVVDGRVLDEDTLELERTEAVIGRLEHIVVTSDEGQVAVAVT